MSCFENAFLFGDQNFSSGDHFTKGSRQRATSGKLELEALLGQDTLLSVPLSNKSINGYHKFNAGGNPAMDQHSIQAGVEILDWKLG